MAIGARAAIAAPVPTGLEELDVVNDRAPAPAAVAELARLRADASMLRIGVVSQVDERYAVPDVHLGR
jgi:hypothetical protein